MGGHSSRGGVKREEMMCWGNGECSGRVAGSKKSEWRIGQAREIPPLSPREELLPQGFFSLPKPCSFRLVLLFLGGLSAAS